MATRSYIGQIDENGGVRYVYAHWDGYPDHNGRILHEHWRDRDAVSRLLDEGDVSILGTHLGVKHGFDDDEPTGGCKFYMRDRGEEGCEAQYEPSHRAYLMDKPDDDRRAWAQEFHYLQGLDGNWIVWCSWLEHDEHGVLPVTLAISPELRPTLTA